MELDLTLIFERNYNITATIASNMYYTSIRTFFKEYEFKHVFKYLKISERFRTGVKASSERYNLSNF